MKFRSKLLVLLSFCAVNPTNNISAANSTFVGGMFVIRAVKLIPLIMRLIWATENARPENDGKVAKGDCSEN